MALFTAILITIGIYALHFFSLAAALVIGLGLFLILLPSWVRTFDPQKPLIDNIIDRKPFIWLMLGMFGAPITGLLEKSLTPDQTKRKLISAVMIMISGLVGQQVYEILRRKKESGSAPEAHSEYNKGRAEPAVTNKRIRMGFLKGKVPSFLFSFCCLNVEEEALLSYNNINFGKKRRQINGKNIRIHGWQQCCCS
ncbi:MAG: hypothetical protein II712_03090 [Erysipelotrichaceae bacterium]|nr:hypothetical protein [Erysipelotrichaceae bacterium]